MEELGLGLGLGKKVDQVLVKVDKKGLYPRRRTRSLIVGISMLFIHWVSLFGNNLKTKKIDADGQVHYPPFREQQIHFRTYGNDRFARSKRRIVQEAIDTGWFASVKALGPEDLSPEFQERYHDILALPRGGGYMIWKFDVFKQAMSAMREGDFLVYLDAGSQVNKGGEARFREYINLVNDSHYDILTFQLTTLPEYQWTTKRLLMAFDVEGQTNITHTGQYESGDLVFQKGPHFRKWYELCNEVINMDPWMITDKYNNESQTFNPTFKENRHDQSIMSVGWKKLGCISFPNGETYRKSHDKPFYAGRIRE